MSQLFPAFHLCSLARLVHPITVTHNDNIHTTQTLTHKYLAFHTWLTTKIGIANIPVMNIHTQA